MMTGKDGTQPRYGCRYWARRWPSGTFGESREESTVQATGMRGSSKAVMRRKLSPIHRLVKTVSGSYCRTYTFAGKMIVLAEARKLKPKIFLDETRAMFDSLNGKIDSRSMVDRKTIKTIMGRVWDSVGDLDKDYERDPSMLLRPMSPASVERWHREEQSALEDQLARTMQLY